MKVQGFLEDVGGASRVTETRRNAFANASDAPVTADPINDVAKQLHPGRIELVVTEVRDASKTTRTIRLVAADGRRLPLFYAGQYMVVELDVGESHISRPYSISSSPSETCCTPSYVEITVRKSKGNGFISNILYNDAKAGNRYMCTVGCGQLYYEPLRDAEHIVAIAGGTGITPFASMAKEIKAGRLNADLTIFFGSVSSDDIVLKADLDAVECENVHVVHVLSGDEPDWQGERGFITAELIRKYCTADSTYFICGPQVMYGFIRKVLDKLEIPKRRIRFEVFGQSQDITSESDYPAEKKDCTFRLTVVRGIHEDVIPAKATESIAVALERAGIRIETGCRSGECGLCRSKLISGDLYIRPVNDGRRAADKDFGYFHACASYPLSDVKVKIPIL